MTKTNHTLIFSIWLGYVFFVVYGSLVPLDFKPLPLDQAWVVFQHTPMYKLGVASRADWIANGVLYIPVGFLTIHLLTQVFFKAKPVPLYFLAGLASVALAVSVEFVQIFFPARTVSLNDIIAEWVGSLIGLVLAVRYSDWFKLLTQAISSNPQRLVLRLSEAYLAAYVAFCLFPYDILLSGAEIEDKLRGESWGWLLAGDSHGRFLVALKALSEIILTVPFGLFLGYRGDQHSTTYKQAIWLGILLGGFIEIAQFFTATGVSQGVSVATRIAGACIGVALWQRRANWSPERLTALVRQLSLPLGIIYLLLLLQTNGWFSYHWKGPTFAIAKLDELHFLPFYYHYFTTEAKALFSLASICLMYLPIGLLTWSNRGSPARAFFYALCAASLVESGKLFLQGIHPDPTNIMLGALASWGMHHLAETLSTAARLSAVAETTVAKIQSAGQGQSELPAGRDAPVSGPRLGRYALLFPLLAFVAYWIATFPIHPALLGLFLAACATAIWQRPGLIFAIVPAALPVFDLAQWSGRFYLDEFDLLVLICCAIGYSRIPATSRSKRRADAMFVSIAGLLGLSIVIGVWRGLLPWPTVDANAFTNYYSTFNALRIGKGALWAFLIYALLRRFEAAGIDTRRPLAMGLVCGLAITVAVIFWERLTFSSLFDFASDYRVTGPFSSMHMGGAYIECFLAIATSFLVLLVLQSTSRVSQLAGVLLLLATTYAMMVTFSRNGYAAFAVVLSIIMAFALFKSGRWQHRSILVALLLGTILLVAIPIVNGRFAQERIAAVGKDYAVREAHWADALNIRTPDLLTTLFGMGIGRYPESHYLFSSEAKHAGTYQLRSEDGNPFLRLGAGDPIYVEQIISVEPRQNYTLRLKLRVNKPNQTISFSLCEKWLLTSMKCVQVPIPSEGATGVWQNAEAFVASEALGDNPWFARKPIKFALNNLHGGAQLDVDDVQLISIGGENLLFNGDFSASLDHWYFSADSHLQWHVKSLPVAVLFDQGWFGLIVWCLFSLFAIKRAACRAWTGDLYSAAALASFSGFLVVGLFDTLIDAPRFLFLVILLGCLCGFNGFPGRSERQNG